MAHIPENQAKRRMLINKNADADQIRLASVTRNRHAGATADRFAWNTQLRPELAWDSKRYLSRGSLPDEIE